MRTTEEIIKELLAMRGISGQENIDEFLSARPKMAHDPFLLHNMKAGVDLILSEIKAGTKICIYGDYDADGVTSTSILCTFLKNITDNYCYYIPSRFTDGYGLNISALDKIKAMGVGLVITVDCGSVAYKEVEHAKEIGLKIVVTDHHTISSVKADCIVINPKQKECNYPFKDLAGCGVAFKLAQALRITLDLPREILNDCLDLVAIGTVADIVPLLDENRTMVKYGLIKINNRSRMPIAKLVDGINLNKVLSGNISFGIAPHINAMGRMGDATEVVDFFLTDDVQKAQMHTEHLIQANRQRKEYQEKAYNECMEMIDPNDPFIAIVKDNIHEGIAGIVAGKVKEETKKPCVIITSKEDGRLTGTGRSIEPINLYNYLKEFEELFLSFGGHSGACGFSLEEKNLNKLINEIRSKGKRLLEENPEIFKVSLPFDMELTPNEMTIELYDEILKMEPFGQCNQLPKFKIKNVMLTKPFFMGDEKQHVRMTAVNSDYEQMECILFNKASQYADIIQGMSPVEVIGTLDVNEWNGNKKVQMKVEDIIANGQ